MLGYLIRLVELNHYDAISWILALSGIDSTELYWKQTFLFTRSTQLKRLAQITDNTESELLPLLYLPAAPTKPSGSMPTDFSFYGAHLNRSIIRPHCPKVCPQCLLEYGYCNRIWDCSLVTVCPIHRSLLVDICPRCKKRIGFARNKVSICPCGFDWRRRAQRQVSRGELVLSRQVYYLCGALPKQHISVKATGKNPLYDLSLRDLAVAVTFIAGLYESVSWAVGQPTRSTKWFNKDLHRLYPHAFMTFENWPNNLYHFLEEQAAGVSKFNSRDGRLDTILSRAFYSFYKGLYKKMPGKQYDFIRSAFAEYLTARWRKHYARSSKLLTGSDALEGKAYTSVTEARRLLRINHKLLFDLVRNGEIEFAIRNQGEELLYLLRLSDVERVKSAFELSVPASAVAAELGVSRTVVCQLGRAGYLQLRLRPAVDGYKSLRFDRSAAGKLLSKVSSRVKKVGKLSFQETYNFSAACQLTKPLGITVAMFIKAVVDGEVHPCAEISVLKGLLRFVFLKIEVLNYAKLRALKRKSATSN